KLRSGRHQLGLTSQVADELVTELRTCLAVEQAAVVGSVRRMADTIGNGNLLVASRRPNDVREVVHGLGHGPEGVEDETCCATIVVRRGVRVDVRAVEPAAWGAALVYHTGSAAHVARLQSLAAERGWTLDARGLDTGPHGPALAGASEDEIYDAL